MKGGPKLRSPEIVMEAACAFTGFTPAQICEQNRSQSIVWLRHEVIHCLREMTGLPLTAIGQMVGGRDSKTVLNALARSAKRCAEDSAYAEHLERMRRFVRDYDPAPRATGAAACARRLMDATGPGDAHDLALLVLMTGALLADASLSDAEARQAALSVFRKGGPA